MQLALANLASFIAEVGRLLTPVVGVGGLLFTVILWLFVLAHGRSLERRLQVVRGPIPSPVEEAPKAAPQDPSAAVRYARAIPDAAVQILAILQREGRFIDFLQEDLTSYEDAQIGAAVRNIHEGCRRALEDHVTLEPIYGDREGDAVTVREGFDAAAVRLTGSVAGHPPFHGTLRHRGWRATRVELPEPTGAQGREWVVAPAEVEIGTAQEAELSRPGGPWGSLD
jgi:hypothetical protein